MNAGLKDRLSAPTLFGMLLLANAVLPHLLRLPGWVALAAMAAGGWALAARRLLPSARARAAATGVFAAVALAGAWFAFGGKFTGEGTLAFLVWALLLKHAEAESGRDRLFNAFGALLLAAWLPLFHDSLAGMLLAASASLLFFLVLAARAGVGLGATLAGTGRLWLAALPFAALLFAFFPRIPGPLWDIGLALGLPIRVEVEHGPSGLGVDDTLGAESEGLPATRKDPTILVAEFEDFVPNAAELYWRGPVFWRFDGATWTPEHPGFSRGLLLKDAYKTGERLSETLSRKDKRVRYRVRAMPNGKNWLYGLDLPAENPAESFVSRDFQVYSVRAVKKETQFEAAAWLDYASAAPLADDVRALGLQLPENSDRRLIALGREAAAAAKGPHEAIRRILAKFAGSGIHVAPANPVLPGPDALDRVFFDTRAAHPTQMAGAFALAARAAGVPTRLVAGFRGGRVMALTQFLVVKQSHAHVWAESWLPGTGWTRYDPVDFGARPESVAPPQAVQSAAASQPERTAAAPAAEAAVPVRRADPEAGEALAQVRSALEKWVLRFDAARQSDLLAELGVARVTWWSVLAVALAAGLALAGLYAGISAWRARRRQDPVVAAWRRVENRLEAIGLRREPAECVSRFAGRAVRLRPDLAAGLDPLVRRYLRLRYGVGTPEEIRDFARNARGFSAWSA